MLYYINYENNNNNKLIIEDINIATCTTVLFLMPTRYVLPLAEQ